MEMQVNAQLIRFEREKRAWSQSHLASVSGLGLRTIQRIEANGSASYESAAAIAAVLSITVADLIGHDMPRVAPPHPRALGKWSTTTRFAVPSVLIVAAAALVLTIGQNFNWSVPADIAAPSEPITEPGGSVATPRAERDAVTADRTPVVKCPAESLSGRRLLNLEIECEDVDPNWAPDMERQLAATARAYLAQNPDLDEKYRLGTVRCRTTICEIQFSDSMPATTTGLRYDPRDRDASDPDRYLRRALIAVSSEIYEQPWGTQFDIWSTIAIGSFLDAENRIYLVKAAEQVSRL